MCIGIVGLFLAFGPHARADASGPLAEVQRLVGEGDFEAGERKAHELLASGKASRAAVARLHLELGVVAAARNDGARAELSFRKALRLDPTLQLTETAGPHIIAAFTRAQQTVSGVAPVGVSVRFARPADRSELEVWVDVRGESDGLVRGVVLDGGGFTAIRHDVQGAQTRWVLPLPAPSRECQPITASVVDENGNRLWPDLARSETCGASRRAAESGSPNRVSLRPAPTRLEPIAERSIPIYVWLGAAATAGLVIATTVTGFVALDRRDYYHRTLDQPELPRSQKAWLRERASDAERTATIFGVASALAAGATAALYLIRPGARTAVGVQVAPASGARLVGLSGCF